MLKVTIPAAIAAIVMSVISLIRYFRWSRFGTPGVGTVGERIDMKFREYNNSLTGITYIYQFHIDIPEKTFASTISEYVSTDEEPKLAAGSNVDVLVNPKNGKYKRADELKRDIKQRPIAAACFTSVSIILIIICIVLANI